MTEIYYDTSWQMHTMSHSITGQPTKFSTIFIRQQEEVALIRIGNSQAPFRFVSAIQQVGEQGLVRARYNIERDGSMRLYRTEVLEDYLKVTQLTDTTICQPFDAQTSANDPYLICFPDRLGFSDFLARLGQPPEQGQIFQINTANTDNTLPY